MDISTATCATIYAPCGLKAGEGIFIELMALALEIRSGRQFAVDPPFIPREAEPKEIVFDLPGIFETGALRVEILDAKDPTPTASLYR